MWGGGGWKTANTRVHLMHYRRQDGLEAVVFYFGEDWIG